MRFLRLSRLRREQGGYTLVEMLTVLVILGIVMQALTTLFVQASNAENDMNNRFQAQQTARVALDKLRREVHCASSATPAGSSMSSVTLTLPSYCKTGSGSITWCTRLVSSNRYALYRMTGTTCTGGVKWADYLTTANVFGYTAVVANTTSAKLSVDLPVNVNPRKSVETYEVKDDIVLRNSQRCSTC